MKSNTNYHSVNWIDGMKINKNHFIDQENALQNAINNAQKNGITPVNYGLLPDFSDKGSTVDISVSIDGQSTIEVLLNKCQAITLGGYLINISEQTKPLLDQSGYILKKQYKIDSKETEFYIVITINPFVRVPVGNADPNEEPPRHPFILPEYKLNVLTKSEVNTREIGLHHLTLAKVIVEEGVPALVENFIPPCTSIQSHADLKFTFNEIVTFFNMMESFSMHIIQKIYQKKQTNELAHMVLHLSQNVIAFLNKAIPEFRMQNKYQAPIVMINKLASLAREIKNSLDAYIGTGKEELLNYLTDWCDLNQGAFENVLIDMLEIKYEHTDINASLHKVSGFTKLMLSLFKKLNELDYIGKKEDSGIFVKENIVEDTETKGRRSFLLD
ncbi:MAG: hypothetical protein ACPG6B_10945 [Oceanihabitans sp.]